MIENKTNIPTEIVESIAEAAGVTAPHLAKSIRVIYDKRLKQENGYCRFKGEQITIALRENFDISTLAHELKHAEQYNTGRLVESTVYSGENEYWSHWAEIEAREFEKKYK
jgi:hypothetical protein